MMNNDRITVKIESTKSVIVCFLKYNDETFCRYSFKTKKNITKLGKRLIEITLLRYALLDSMICPEIFIEFSMSNTEKLYIENEINNMIDYTLRYNDLSIPKPSLIYYATNKHYYEEILLDDKKAFIGYSGGKDSMLCYDLVKDEYDSVEKFKINFDNENFDNEYYEGIEVINENYYKKFSTKQFYNANNVDYYQEEDLHCCFVAPFIGIQNAYPSTIIVGLQFDVVNHFNYDKSGILISEFGLTETYNSIKTLESLVHSYGIKNYKITVPLASATSFTIYNILLKTYGIDALKKMNSCWYATNTNEPCGECIKCQRVSFIYNKLGLKLSNIEQKSLDCITENKVALDYLFGSNSIKRLITNEKRFQLTLEDTIFYDDKIKDIDNGFSIKMQQKYNLKLVKNPLVRE